MFFKKTLAILLIITTLLPLAACTTAKKGSENEEKQEETEQVPEYSTKKTVGNPSAIGEDSTINSIFPTIKIDVDGKEDIVSKYYYLGASITVNNCPYEYRLNNVRAEVRKRGNGTYSWEKGSIRIRFEEKYNLFGQANGYGRSWVLLANMGDPCMLRTHTVFTMAHTLENISWTSSSSFVHLYINGKYRGVYQLVEQHNMSDGRIVVNEDPNVVDTDYLIELDEYADRDGSRRGTDWFQVNKFNYNGGSGHGTKVNKYLIRSDYNTRERCMFLEDYFQKADAAVLKGDFEEVSQYLDLASFVDMYILQELVRNGDVGWSSFYMVKKGGDKIYFTCPWDFDLSFGRDARIHNNSYKYLHAGNGMKLEKQSHTWYFNLFKRKWFVDMVAKRWNEVAMGMRDAALDEINRLYGDFYDEFMKNYNVWDVRSLEYNEDFILEYKQDTFDEHVQFLKLYLCKRFDWLDNYFNSDQKYEQLVPDGT